MAAEALRMSRAVRFAPLALLLIILGALIWRLATPGNPEVSSKLVGQPLPDVRLGALTPETPPLRLRSLRGKPIVINFFASWCVPCVAEAQILTEMKRKGARIIGIAVRDRPDDVAEFLATHGNPYETIGADPESSVQIALGSSGVPESFVVDGTGIIRYQHIGPIEPADLPVILAKLDEVR